MTGPARFAVLTALVFGLIYNISFLAAPSVTTGRLAVLALICWTGRKGIRALHGHLTRHWAGGAILGVVSLYTAALFFLSWGEDFSQPSRLMHLTLYSFVGAGLVVAAVDGNRLQFLQAFAAATAVQSLLIGYSFGSVSYREWLSSLLVQGGNIPLTRGVSAPGFSNSSGALLSLIQGLGAFAGMLGVRLSRGRGEQVGFGAAALLCALSTLVVGRTGMQLTLAAAVLFALTSGPGGLLRLGVAIGVVGLLVGLYWNPLLDALSNINPNAPATLERAFRVFVLRTDEPSVQSLLAQVVPPLGLETTLGTGLVVGGLGGGNASGNDSGYIQTYYALGLPMAIIFYLTILSVFVRLWATSDHRRVMAGLIALMFVVELKEPFILKHVYPFFALALLWLSQPIAATRPPVAVTDPVPTPTGSSAQWGRGEGRE